MKRILFRIAFTVAISAVAAVPVSMSVLRHGPPGGAPVRVFLAYFVLFAVVSLAASFAATALRPNHDNSWWIAAVASTIALGLLFGARPTTIPLLSELVDDGCQPELTVLPYALADPHGFWIEVKALTEREVELADDGEGHCQFVPDPAQRQDCVERRELTYASVDYCARHAERRLSKKPLDGWGLASSAGSFLPGQRRVEE